MIDIDIVKLRGSGPNSVARKPMCAAHMSVRCDLGFFGGTETSAMSIRAGPLQDRDVRALLPRG
jgi:hypothetical protein